MPVDETRFGVQHDTASVQFDRLKLMINVDRLE